MEFIEVVNEKACPYCFIVPGGQVMSYTLEKEFENQKGRMQKTGVQMVQRARKNPGTLQDRRSKANNRFLIFFVHTYKQMS